MKLKSPPTFALVPVESIHVSDRFRKDLGDIDEFAKSIENRRFLFAPLVVDRATKRLLAGGRRLEAVRKLGWKEVQCHLVDEIDDITAKEIELEENLQRKNLTWQESSLLTQEIDKLYKRKYGDNSAGGNIEGQPRSSDRTQDPSISGWSSRRTAVLQGVSEATVSRGLSLATALKIIPSLNDEPSQTNALKKLKRIEEDIVRELLLRRRDKEVKSLSSSVILGDATSLICSLESASVDCIITDPPYGDDNLAYGNLHREQKDYNDSPDDVMGLLRSIGPELRRVLKPSGHLYAFFGPQLWQQSITIWKSAGFDVHDIICIWHKTGGATGTVNWDHDYAPAWEPFLFASNRERRLHHKHDNVFTGPPDLGVKRQHPNQKPLWLIKELLEESTDLGDLVLDPFGGSGSIALACQQSNRRFLTYELNPRYHTIILERLSENLKNAPIRSDEVINTTEMEEAQNNPASTSNT